MSGGSLNYIGHAMENGNLFSEEWAIQSLPERLRECLASQVDQIYNEAYTSAPFITKWDKSVPSCRPITDGERSDVARYGQEALRMMEDLLSTMIDLKRKAVELAPLAHTLDRRGSGDDGDSTVWETILSWGRARDNALRPVDSAEKEKP